MRPAYLFGATAASAPWDPVALAGVALWIAHFVKREFETFFVHRFSRPTMPLSEYGCCMNGEKFTLSLGSDHGASSCGLSMCSEPIQEQHLLLGLCTSRGLSPMPSVVHRTGGR